VPSNKIGQLKTGEGLRRIQAQRMGDWGDEAAVNNYEIGDELNADKSAPEIPNHAIQKAGSSNH
jgi:hypothetical protein